MKLAFELGPMRDPIDEEINDLPVEYEPSDLNDAYKYIRDNRKSPYFSINFDPNLRGAIVVDFGSYVEFCYIWDLKDEDRICFTSDITTSEDSEEVAQRRFAYNVLSELKSRRSISYEEAVAISKILKLGGE